MQFGLGRLNSQALGDNEMTPIKPIAGAASALALLTLSGLPAGATTPVSGALNAVANSTINDTTISDLQNFSWSGVPTTLSTSVLATVVNGGDFITTSGDATASWASPDAGSVTFLDYGWNFSVNDPTTTLSASNLTQGRGGDDWTYTFTATSNGTIILTYNSTFSGGNDAFGLWGWNVDFSGSGSGFPVLSANDPTQDGVFTGILVAGQTYTIGLNGNPNISTNGPIDISGYMNGSFSWQITASGVPEPSTWAMLMLGFAGFGFAGYRQSKRAPIAA
jgi:PEP-CTERM motif